MLEWRHDVNNDWLYCQNVRLSDCQQAVYRTRGNAAGTSSAEKRKTTQAQELRGISWQEQYDHTVRWKIKE